MNIKKILAGAGATALLLGNVMHPAFALTFNNGSFENGTDPGGFMTVLASQTNIDNWTVNSGSVDYIGTYWDASDGTRSIDLSGNEPGSISQELTTVSGATYKVSFDLSGNPDGGENEKNVEVSANDGTIQNYAFDKSVITDKATDMKWAPQEYQFVAAGPSTILKFRSLETDAYGPAVDKIVVTEELPVTPTVIPSVTPSITVTPNPYAIPTECSEIAGLGAPIVGTNGSEILNGTAGNDLIFARGGSDVVNGKAGDDCIVAGNGSDVVIGGAGHDVILGGDGSDSINGDQGNDMIYGSGGSDDLNGGVDNDQIWGGAGSDSLKGGAGTDTLIGDGGSDAANGNAGTDTCNAEAESSCEL